MALEKKQYIKFSMRILITAVLLVWVFRQIDFQQLLAAVRTSKWQYLVTVWLLTVVLFWIRSIRLRLILKHQECTVRTSTIFIASSVTALYSLVLPAVISTAMKWYILKKDTGKSKNVFSGMLYNQISMMIVMLVFGLIALMISNPVKVLKEPSAHPWLLPVVSGIAVVVIVCTTLLLLNERFGGRIINRFRFILKMLPAKINEKINNVLDQILTFQSATAGFHIQMFVFAIADTLLGSIATYILAARAAGITAPVIMLIWLCALVYVLGRIPISIANLGVREVTLVGLLGLYGVANAQALLMSIILFSALLVIAAIGAVYMLYSIVHKQGK